ncbi:hypothetical protein JA9_004782 [Meyerozyma sp. JA9]|nr:hypothetical protein JA9_004782 [Meyerozyma sp. JA9]
MSTEDQPSDNEIPDDQVINDIFSARATKHADDAVDYEDIDELADDEDPLESFGGDLAQQADAEESKFQEEADQEFDDMFGEGGDETGHNEDLFADNRVNDVEIDADMGDIFHDDNTLLSPESQPSRKRSGPKLSEEDRERKKQRLRDAIAKLKENQKARQLNYYFPDFDKSKPYNNHLLFLPEPRFFSYLTPPLATKSFVKPLIPKKLTLEVEEDESRIFRSRRAARANKSAVRGITKITDADVELANKAGSADTDVVTKTIPFLEIDGYNEDKFQSYDKNLILSAADWDDDQIINGKESTQRAPQETTQGTAWFISKSKDEDAEYLDDERIFSGQIADDVVKLDMNDPGLLFVPDKSSKSQSKALVPSDEKSIAFKFNISNDKSYDILKQNYNTKVRSQLSNLTIEHSVPALRLQSPYYKVKLSKHEARNFHRPRFDVRPGTLISFSKLKVRKKKKDKGKTTQELVSKTSDLTNADTSSLLALEYSEQYPPILSNFGMGSKIINYYRKEKDDDNARPKAPIGETHVLGVEDRSPFWNFGHVARGDFVPTLYNNMLRAPIFKNEMKNTDFLLVRSQGAGSHQKYYLRGINHMFAVGNIFPVMEVPAPHSRKVTNASKNRLRMIVFRSMNANDESRISVKDISHHFPDQNDMQNRQRLKEFMEYNRTGEDQGFWKIKKTDSVPSEEDIRAMLTPEDVTLLDAMQHGNQMLDDIFYIFGDETKEDRRANKRKKDEDEEEEAEKSKKDNKEKEIEDIDEELAPWNATRNFLISNQTKSMLQLNGEGDPTGIGLGFSFLRCTQKSGFTPLFAPVKENVPKNSTASYQQKLYEDEVSRIWYAQRRSLTVDPHHGQGLNFIYREYKPANHQKYVKNRVSKDRMMSSLSDPKNPKVLKISRRFRDENGILQRKEEVISDPRIIKAYVKRKKQVEDEMLRNADVDEIIPTNDKELNRIRRKALEERYASLEKKSKLGRGKKSKDPNPPPPPVKNPLQNQPPDGSPPVSRKGIGKGKNTNRKCATCGAYGHISTNKSCPLYSQRFGKGGGIGTAADDISEFALSQ